MNGIRTLWPGLLLAALPGCSPTLDWREIRPEDAGIGAMFPCRPDRFARQVVVAGAPVRMEMLVCEAGGATYAVSFFDVAEPAAVNPALAGIRQAAAANIGAPAASAVPVAVRVAGMTPNAEAGKVALAGRLPDGASVREEAAFFAKGLRVYQASVIGARLVPDAIDTFFSGLMLSR